LKKHRQQCGPTLGDGRVEQPLAKWRQYVEMNGHATCTFSEYCHFVRITAECCDVLLDPTQCFRLVLQGIIARRCVVSSAQESFGKLIRNYVEMLKGKYFSIFFSEQNCWALCYLVHRKTPSSIQTASF
jgi:hypothetical protein